LYAIYVLFLLIIISIICTVEKGNMKMKVPILLGKICIMLYQFFSSF